MGLPPINNVLKYESDAVALSNVIEHQVDFTVVFATAPFVTVSLSGSSGPMVTSNISTSKTTHFIMSFSAPFTGTLFYQALTTTSDRAI